MTEPPPTDPLPIVPAPLDATGRPGPRCSCPGRASEPLDVLPGVAASAVVGVEAVLWSETVRTPEDLFFLLLPRLAAFAEVAWSAPRVRGWDGFAARVRTLGPRWDAEGLSWYRSPQVGW